MEKVKNGRMEVRMKWKYGMALLGFRTLLASLAEPHPRAQAARGSGVMPFVPLLQDFCSPIRLQNWSHVTLHAPPELNRQNVDL